MNKGSNTLGYGCTLPFDTDDPMFAYGVEIGALWADLEANPEAAIRQTIHGRNSEMAIRMAEALERPYEAKFLDDENRYLEVIFHQSERARNEETPGAY